MLSSTQSLSPTTPSSNVEREEAEAVRLAMEGRWLPSLKLGLGALRKLLQNPDDTRQVFVLSIALNAHKLPDLLARFLADEQGCTLLAERAAINTKSVDYDALRALPADTLGGAYVRFLDEHGLDPDLFQAPPGMSAAPAYVTQRMRQTHDIWHVVTGYSPELGGELSLLAFTYAQTGAPALGLLATVGSMRHWLERGSVFGEVWRGYQRGKRARFLGNVPWETLWELPIAEVRQRLLVA